MLICAGFLFTLDILLLFHTGFIITCNLRKRLIMDGYFVARYYAKHASLLADILATVPAWIEVRLLSCFGDLLSLREYDVWCVCLVCCTCIVCLCDTI